MQRSKAFTLIELLVVIAIIAILAAILFPVFAQAKSAAKKAAEISNKKQQALATTMYAGDSDDVLPPFNDMPISDADCSVRVQWNQRIFPYVKNSGIFLDPNGPRKVAPQDMNDTRNYAARPDSAMNWHFTTFTRPVANICGNDFSSSGVPISSLERVAEGVIIGNTGVNDWFGNGSLVGAAGSMNPWHPRFVGDTVWASAFCQQRYDAYEPYVTTRGQSAWAINWRHNGTAGFAFADGHAATKKKGSLKWENFYPGTIDAADNTDSVDCGN